ncbi:MAG: ABC transporter ATP-binding protein [Candidatus Aureabacteria bacterium]|nr:ABC transporter ATP-binding protein [Candidatus Auribacterota bacterium]
MKTTEPILEIKQLSFSYGTIKALDEFNMRVPKGSICAFVGRNGAGKTTTFSVIAGFLRFHAGSISLCGQNLHEFRKSGKMIGLLPQEVSFFDDRTIFSQLVFLARLSGLSKNEAENETRRVLSRVSLLDQAGNNPHELSRGMKMRLGIAQAILACPPLILLDEPTAGLDPVIRSQFYELIKELKNDTTFVISSHNLSELETLCDMVCFIEKGKSISMDTMDHLLQAENTVHFKIGNDSIQLENLKTTFTDLDFYFERDGNVLSVTSKNSCTLTSDINKTILPWLLQNHIPILEVTPKVSLHQKYLKQLTQNQK